jgi:hypothetical protein
MQAPSICHVDAPLLTCLTLLNDFTAARQVFVDFEDRAETGNLQELLDSAGQVEQFQISPGIARGGITRH